MQTNRTSSNSSSLKRKAAPEAQVRASKRPRPEIPTTQTQAAQAAAGSSSFTPSTRTDSLPKHATTQYAHSLNDFVGCGADWSSIGNADVCDTLRGHPHRSMIWITEVNLNPTYYKQYFRQTFDHHRDATGTKFATVVLELPCGLASEAFPLAIPQDDNLRGGKLDPLAMACQSLGRVCRDYLNDAQKREVKPYQDGLNKAHNERNGFAFQAYWALITRTLRGFKAASNSKRSSDLCEEGRLVFYGDAAKIQRYLVVEARRVIPQPEGINKQVQALVEKINVEGASRIRCIGKGAMYLAAVLAIKANGRCDIAVAIDPEQLEDARLAWSHVQKRARDWDLLLYGSVRISCVERGEDDMRAFLGSADAIFWCAENDTGQYSAFADTNIPLTRVCVRRCPTRSAPAARVQRKVDHRPPGPKNLGHKWETIEETTE
ncbi:unnamed protein product [Peniophora sp. CBMAI 1063]|nr:unnamed protein product [Peniophora sp. CBMAI 1063]